MHLSQSVVHYWRFNAYKCMNSSGNQHASNRAVNLNFTDLAKLSKTTLLVIID
jgi:hypothetical protein